MSDKEKECREMSNCYDSNFLIWQNMKFIIVIVAFFTKEWAKAEVERKMDQVNVAIADDNERMLELLGNIITSDKDLSLVGKANNGADVYQIIKTKEPDVVLLDLIMPKVDGLSVMDMVNKDRTIQ